MMDCLSDKAAEKSKAIKQEGEQPLFYLDYVNKQAHRDRDLWRTKPRNVKELFAAASRYQAINSWTGPRRSVVNR
jgi:hypothetical protein